MTVDLDTLFLSRLPLSALPLPEGLARRLRPLGLETLGDFASLPVGSVERRYGQAGVALHRLARGLDERGLLPEREQRTPSVMSEPFLTPTPPSTTTGWGFRSALRTCFTFGSFSGGCAVCAGQ